MMEIILVLCGFTFGYVWGFSKGWSDPKPGNSYWNWNAPPWPWNGYCTAKSKATMNGRPMTEEEVEKHFGPNSAFAKAFENFDENFKEPSNDPE